MLEDKAAEALGEVFYRAYRQRVLAIRGSVPIHYVPPNPLPTDFKGLPAEQCEGIKAGLKAAVDMPEFLRILGEVGILAPSEVS